jgi:DedD protein
MKFMGSSETKQPLPITSAEQTKKLPSPMAQTAAPMPTDDSNSAVKASSNTTTAGDEKLNAIVKKLQQDAQVQATASSTQQPASAPAAVVSTPATTTVPVTVTKQAPEAQTQKQAKTTVVAVPIKTAPAEYPQPQKQKEPAKKEDVKTAFKDATKNVVKPKPQQKQAVKPQDAKVPTVATTAGAHYIQVGYFESEVAAKGVRDKVNSVGFGSTTRQAVKNDKNITKVWVGPFESKEEAAKALPKIREQIKSDAFVVKG